MDKNRKIIISILSFLVLSCILAFINISITLKKKPASSDVDLTKALVDQVSPGVGVVRIYGPITLSGYSTGGGFSRAAGADDYVNKINRFMNSEKIRAVVLRINSPGGTVAATQEIYQKLLQLRKRNIPVVVSMGDLAASGGYYVAAASDYIFANHGTITGSIGVIISSPNLQEAFKKLGVRMNVIKSGKYKDILSSYRELGSEERNLLQNMIDTSYKKFLDDVVFGRNNIDFNRKIRLQDVKPYADGRVFSGAEAVKYKLVDAVGTFEDALNKAREMAKLPKTSPVYEDVKTPWEKLMGNIQVMLNIKSPMDKIIPGGTNSLIEYRYLP